MTDKFKKMIDSSKDRLNVLKSNLMIAHISDNEKEKARLELEIEKQESKIELMIEVYESEGTSLYPKKYEETI